MSDPTTQPHPFARPGQVDPDFPPPDNCVRCGASEAAHIGGSYAAEATNADEELDRQLAEVRRQADAGLIDVREAADLRVVVLEHHIRQIKALRIAHFGSDDGAS